MSQTVKSILGTPEIRRLIDKLDVIKVAGTNHARLMQWTYSDPRDNSEPVYRVTGAAELIKALLPHFQSAVSDVHDMEMLNSGELSLDMMMSGSQAPQLVANPLSDARFASVTFPKAIVEDPSFPDKLNTAILKLPNEFDISHREWALPSKIAIA